MPFVARHIIPHDKTDAADKDQCDNDEVYNDIPLERDKRGVCLVYPHQVKSAVAESRNRMKNPIVHPAEKAKFRHKADGQKYCPCAFK